MPSKASFVAFFQILLQLGAFHGRVLCDCVIEEYLTTIVSPNFPDQYPTDTRREWSFEILSGEIGHIKFNSLLIERKWDSLTVSHASKTAHGTNVTTFQLVSGNVTSLLLPEGVVTIRFCSDKSVVDNGFAIDVRTLAVDGGGHNNGSCGQPSECKRLEFVCSSGMQLIDVIARCDKVVDCHDFSDEIGCHSEDIQCPYRCNGTDICLLEIFRCDGWYDCPQRDDEKNCGAVKCPDGYICGASPHHDNRFPPTHACGDSAWHPFWVNATNAWRKDYNNVTAKKTVILNMGGIPQMPLEVGSFHELNYLQELNLDSCGISYLPPGVFDGLHRLYRLTISNNKLTILEKGTFRNLFYLTLLWMEINRVNRFEEGCFQDLHSLFFIDLHNNTITDLRPGTFQDLGKSIERIILTNNYLTLINASIFYGIEDNLLRVNFDNNSLEYIAPGTFKNLSKLDDLVITSQSTKPLPIYPDIFDGLVSVTGLYVSDPRFCCLAPDNCVLERPAHPLFTCRKTFLQNFTIKVFMWILGISALLGNGLVLVLRLRSTPTTTVAKVQAMIITNLAVADLLMGLYMVILGVMDIYIGESYFWEGRAEEWRASATCQIAGFISVLSSETSVFLLTLISVDRFICIVFTFTRKRLGVVSTRVAIAVIWGMSALLSAVGVLLNNLNPDTYGLSDVCVGLPFIRKSTNLRTEADSRTSSQYGIPYYTTSATSTVSTWKYSIALFLGVNLCSFLVILISYAAIFIKVRFVRAEAGRTNQSANEIKMALKMFLIIGTDFCCWMPIVIIGILVQTVGVNVTPDIYAWLVVFVLPINSSVNPYLYTIINMGSK